MGRLRILFAVLLITGMFGIGVVDFITMKRGWKVPTLGIIYGISNIIIFLLKE
jgi:hypothetical protein